MGLQNWLEEIAYRMRVEIRRYVTHLETSVNVALANVREGMSTCLTAKISVILPVFGQQTFRCVQYVVT